MLNRKSKTIKVTSITITVPGRIVSQSTNIKLLQTIYLFNKFNKINYILYKVIYKVNNNLKREGKTSVSVRNAGYKLLFPLTPQLIPEFHKVTIQGNYNIQYHTLPYKLGASVLNINIGGEF